MIISEQCFNLIHFFYGFLEFRSTELINFSRSIFSFSSLFFKATIVFWCKRLVVVFDRLWRSFDFLRFVCFAFPLCHFLCLAEQHRLSKSYCVLFEGHERAGVPRFTECNLKWRAGTRLSSRWPIHIWTNWSFKITEPAVLSPLSNQWRKIFRALYWPNSLRSRGIHSKQRLEVWKKPETIELGNKLLRIGLSTS